MKKILFVCKWNVGRSQMAEAFFNTLSGANCAISAGTQAAKYESRYLSDFPTIVDCMHELHYDLSKNKPKQLTPEVTRNADIVVSMIAEDELPDYVKELPNLIYWNIDDPAGQAYGQRILIRDNIETRVRELLRTLS